LKGGKALLSILQDDVSEPKLMMKKLLLLLLLLFTTSIYAKEKLLPTEKSLIEGQFSNGFKYTIKKNTKPRSRAELRLIVKVGSLEEDSDQKGVAHFIEHMAFNGTKHFKKNELIKYLEAIGVKFGAHLNASTSYERTLYKLTVPLEGDNLEKSFVVFQDWASGLSFDKNEFNKERGVVLEEARLGDNAGFRIYNKSKKLFFGDSLYMDRVPIGDKKIIKNISVDRAKEFYTTWYRPEFMHFIAVGDFNTTKIKSLIEKYFKPLKNRNHRKRASREIKDNNTTRVLSVTDKEITSNLLSVSYVDKLEYIRTEEDVREALKESIIYKLFNIKAREQILKVNPKATSITLTQENINSKKSTYTFNVKYNSGDDKSALKELYELIKSFQKYGFSKNDFLLVKKELLERNEKDYRQISDLRSDTISAQLVNYALSHSVYIDYDYNYQLKKRILKSIKLEEINALFRKIMNFKDRFILFINTDGAKVSKDEVLEIIKSADAKDLTKVKKLPSIILDKKLKPTQIVAHQYNKKTDIYKYILKNGIKVIFKPTSFSKDKVILKAFSFGGYSLYGVDSLNDAQKTSLFIDKSGAGEFSSIDLSKILAGKTVTVTTNISKLTENIYAFANSKDIESMFQLLYLKLTEPIIDKRVEKNQKKILKFIAKETTRDPQNRFLQELSKWYQKNNPRVFFDTPESIERLDSNLMLKIYKDRFADLNNFSFAIIGDITVEKIEELISKYFGELPTLKRDETYIDREIDYYHGEVNFIKEYNSENISNILILYKTHIPYSKKNEIALSALVSILNVRLRELIREEKSGVYGIYITADISKLEKNKSDALIHFSCDPKRKDELISYVYKSIEKIKTDFVTDKELNIYKKKFKVSYQTNIKENEYWLENMIDSLKLNTPLEEIYQLPNLVDNISKEDIKDIANKIFGKDRLQGELNPKK
jgi:zinc protease